MAYVHNLSSSEFRLKNIQACTESEPMTESAIPVQFSG